MQIYIGLKLHLPEPDCCQKKHDIKTCRESYRFVSTVATEFTNVLVLLCMAPNKGNQSVTTTDAAFSILYESFSGFMITRPVCPFCIALNTAVPVFPFIFHSLFLFSFHFKVHNTMSPAFSCTDLFVHIASHETLRGFLSEAS